MFKSRILLFLIILLLNFVEIFWYFSLCCPPPHSMHFSPLLCASAVSLSHLLSPCCVHPLFLPTAPLCMFAIYLSPSPAERIHCLSPSPSTCIHPASSSAAAVHMSLFSAAPIAIHTHLPLPAFPHALSSIFYPLLRATLIPVHLYTILPSIFLIFRFLLSSYLHHSSLRLPFAPFLSSSLWSALTNWFYRKNVLVCRGVQACIANHSALCQIWGSQLNSQKNPRFLPSWMQGKVSQNTFLSFFSPHMTALLSSFACKAKYSSIWSICF